MECEQKKLGIWYVYIASCADDTLYTGITTDLHRRMRQHNSRRGGARYTRGRQPVVLVYCEKHASRSLASQREHALKKLPVADKRRLMVSATAACDQQDQDDSR